MFETRRDAAPCLVLIALLGFESSSARAQDPPTPEPAAAVSPEDDVWIDVVWPFEATPEGNYVRVGGHVAVEAINWDQDNSRDDDLETRTLSVLLSGRVGESEFYVDVDLDGEDTRNHLREAWVEHPIGAKHWVRAGWLRVAQASEFATREEDLPFVGYGFTSWENGRFGPGVAVDGYALPWFWWQATMTAGHDANLAGDHLGEPQGSVRVAATPVPGPDGAFEGLFAGLALSQTTTLDGNVHVETPFDQNEFQTSELDGDSRSFVSGELGYRQCGFRGGAEFTSGKVSGVELPAGGDKDYDEIGKYTYWVAWNARGPAPIWSRGRWLPYDLRPGDELPLEFGLRYSNADINRDFFNDGFASFGPSVNEARTITGTVSIYLQPSTRLAFAVLDTISDQVSSNWGEGDFSYMLRLDQRF